MDFFRRETITRCGGKDYLIRWRLLSWRGFGIYLHKFLASDGDDLHDHPWWFASLILKGGYWETTKAGRVLIRPGDILFRPATWTHKVELRGDGKPAWTLVVRGPINRRWGFHLPGGWVHWKSYKEEC